MPPVAKQPRQMPVAGLYRVASATERFRFLARRRPKPHFRIRVKEFEGQSGLRIRVKEFQVGPRSEATQADASRWPLPCSFRDASDGCKRSKTRRKK